MSRRRPSEMLRRVTSNSEAKLSPDGQVRSEGLRESEGKLGNCETTAKGSQNNEDKKERFYEYLVMSGRRG